MDHYSDYLKKAVPVKQLVFDKVGEGDKALIANARKRLIKSNIGLLVLLFIAFALLLWAFIGFILKPSPSMFIEIFSLVGLGFGIVMCADLIWSILGFVSGMRKGVVLAASRQGDSKDGRSRSYQYVFDIYLEDRDQTLMNYSVRPDVFREVQPGDGVIVAKIGRKIKVLADPDRVGVMDVSKIRSGV